MKRYIECHHQRNESVMYCEMEKYKLEYSMRFLFRFVPFCAEIIVRQSAQKRMAGSPH